MPTSLRYKILIIEDDSGISNYLKTTIDAAGYDVLVTANGQNDGDQEMLDTWWIYFSDRTFAQFAILKNTVVLFSEGVYQLAENGSFLYETTPNTDGLRFSERKNICLTA